MSPDKPLLIMKTGKTIPGLRRRGQDFEHWFAAGAGVKLSRFQVRDVSAGDSLPALSDLSGIIVTGSPAYLTDLEPWNFLAADYLRSAQAQGLPVLGVCYGHQLLAWAFGGTVAFNPRGRQIGTVSITITGEGESDPLLAVLATDSRVQVSHQQIVTALPAAAVRLASRSSDENHAFRLGRNCWGVQFHPEFDAGITGAYIMARRKELSSEGVDVEELREALAPTPIARDLLRRFLERG